jgi:uncharacterized membrane protein (DUF485 family)
MAVITIDQIKHQPEYIALTRARSRITWILSVTTFVVYFSVILLIAFAPDSLGEPIGNGVTSVGILLGLGVIFFCFLVTGIYVSYANRVLEPLKQAVVRKLEAVV